MSRHLYYWPAAIALASGLFLAFFYPPQWDTQLIAPWFDATLQRFPLRNNWLLESALHSGLRSALLLVPIATFALLLWQAFQKESCRRTAWLLVAQLLPALIIASLKHESIHACPWDLADYGGYAPHIPLWGSLPAGVSPGRCLPGGHASAGYALLAFYFGFRQDQPRLAQLALWGGLLLGTMMGWVQVMRGAHFMSHNLWSLWITWVTIFLLSLLWSPAGKKEITHAR